MNETKTTKEKVKEFWEKYKTPIIITTSAVAGAVVYKKLGCKHMVKLNFHDNQKIVVDQFNRIDKLKTFMDLGYQLEDVTLKSLGEYGEQLMEVYPGLPVDTKISDILVVTNYPNK